MPPTDPDTMTWDQIAHISHDQIWEAIHRYDREALLLLLARALKYVPVRQVEQVLAQYAFPHEVGAADEPATRPLLEVVREFAEAALRGDYYRPFEMTSQNCTSESRTTEDFEARLQLLLDRCGIEADEGISEDVCAAYEILLGLLREIDAGEKDIVFFADEGGAWQFALQ